MTPLHHLSKTLAVIYLARGADKDCSSSFERFVNSYKQNTAGIDHSLYVIFKGFENDSDLEKAKVTFSSLPYRPIFLDDNNFDIGAYIECANLLEEDLICIFNTASEILAQNWLQKLSVNFAINDVGLVGATASYESLNELNSTFPAFPNIHIRSTAFLIERKLFCRITNGLKVAHKVDAFHFESGSKSLTRLVLAQGKKILLVGRNGRGYSPKFWPLSGTFRQGTQKNLLVADNQTRNFSAFTWNEKREIELKTWGKYLQYNQFLKSEPF